MYTWPQDQTACSSQSNSSQVPIYSSSSNDQQCRVALHAALRNRWQESVIVDMRVRITVETRVALPAHATEKKFMLHLKNNERPTEHGKTQIPTTRCALLEQGGGGPPMRGRGGGSGFQWRTMQWLSQRFGREASEHPDTLVGREESACSASTSLGPALRGAGALASTSTASSYSCSATWEGLLCLSHLRVFMNSAFRSQARQQHDCEAVRFYPTRIRTAGDRRRCIGFQRLIRVVLSAIPHSTPPSPPHPPPLHTATRMRCCIQFRTVFSCTTVHLNTVQNNCVQSLHQLTRKKRRSSVVVVSVHGRRTILPETEPTECFQNLKFSRLLSTTMILVSFHGMCRHWSLFITKRVCMPEAEIMFNMKY